MVLSVTSGGVVNDSMVGRVITKGLKVGNKVGDGLAGEGSCTGCAG